MEVLVRCYLHTEPAEDLDALTEQYVAAMWVEERRVDVIAAGVAKGFGGGRPGRAGGR